MLYGSHHGVYHKMSRKHLNRYVNKLETQHNDCESGTVDQIENLVRQADGKWFQYRDLIT